MSYYLTILLVILLPVYLFGSEIIASWDGAIISKQEFEKSILKEKFIENYEFAKNSKMEIRKQYLNKIINEKLVLQYVKDTKIDTIANHVILLKDKIYYISVYENLLVDSVRNKYFTEYDMIKEYNKRKYYYNVECIMITESRSDKDTAKKLIDNVYNKLSERKVEITNINDIYGLEEKKSIEYRPLGWIRINEIDRQIAKIIPNINVGEISEPFRSEERWCIVKLNDKEFNYSLNSYSAEKRDIRKYLVDEDRKAHIFEYHAFMNRLYYKYNVNIDTVMVNELQNKYTAYSKFTDKSFDKFIELFSDSEKNSDLATSDVKVLKLKDVFFYLQQVENMKKDGMLKEEIKIKNFVVKTFENPILQEAIKDFGYTKDPEIIKEAEMSMTGIYTDYIKKNFLSKKIIVNNDEYLSYYKKNPEKFTVQGKLVSFDEVKSKVKQIVEAQKLNVLEDKWQKFLFKKYNVKINEYILEETFNIQNDIRK